jgi:hypothetical protein
MVWGWRLAEQQSFITAAKSFIANRENRSGLQVTVLLPPA